MQQESGFRDRGGTRSQIRKVVAKLTSLSPDHCSQTGKEKSSNGRTVTMAGNKRTLCSFVPPLQLCDGGVLFVSDEAAVVEEGSPAQSPLVAVTFQRSVHRKQKYLEAEPKALGITQIGLSVYHIAGVSMLLAKGLGHTPTDMPIFITSLLVIIAGSVAIAAQNLHLPTLRACMGMQIISCIASIINMICTLIKMDITPFYCWHYYYGNSTHLAELCHKAESTHYHIFAGGVVIQVALFAISATLAAYCCKVINCCAPAPKVFSTDSVLIGH
ncbi:hypothetical protein L3Q82_017097 [Scortum barcoo]|uniref:Uncharacterized protein n=1 Tax=Scortum barcoo TaxID=214431 RepID=A0ACB8X9M4_9TELE|nr:hypothetical protein L3Q82_017097 [Scortum barcoo]